MKKTKPPAEGLPPSHSKPQADGHAPNRLGTNANAASDATATPAHAVEGVNADGRQVQGAVKSYALLDPDIKQLYMGFYKATYAKSTLDIKTKELIAIAAALTSGCKNCLEGHLKKAKKHGATSAQISETIAITLGVAAASIVDRSDIANHNLGGLFEADIKGVVSPS